MHGHQLHSLGTCLGEVAAVELEPALAFLGRVEVGEERQQAGVLSRRHELLGDLDEPVDAVQRVGRAHVGTGRELDVEAERAATTASTSSGSGWPRPAAQGAQLVAQGGQPAVALRGVAARRTRVVERVDEAALVDDVVLGVGALLGRLVEGQLTGVGRLRRLFAAVDCADCSRRRLRRPWTAHRELAGPPAQRVEVARTEPPARPGEQAYDGVARGRVGEDAQRADDVDDLGLEQQPAEADDLARHATRPQLGLEPGEVRPLAGEHRDLLPRHRVLLAADRAPRRRRPTHAASSTTVSCRAQTTRPAASRPGSGGQLAVVEAAHRDAARRSGWRPRGSARRCGSSPTGRSSRARRGLDAPSGRRRSRRGTARGCRQLAPRQP